LPLHAPPEEHTVLPPPVRDKEPDETLTVKLDEIEVKSYVGGLVKGIERRAA